MAKSPDAFRTIREVSEWLDTPAHVLRFWESKFSQIRPVKRAGGRRYYRPNDMLLLGGIKRLLHEDGHTIKRVQRMLGTDGIKAVAALSQPLSDDPDDGRDQFASAPDVSFISTRTDNRPAASPDLTLVEDAEIVDPTPADAPEPSEAKADIPADPADKAFETLPQPITSAILAGRLYLDRGDNRAKIAGIVDRLIALRSRQDQNRLL